MPLHWAPLRHRANDHSSRRTRSRNYKDKRRLSWSADRYDGIEWTAGSIADTLQTGEKKNHARDRYAGSGNASFMEICNAPQAVYAT